jgi:O-antigen/teichoic acid export membrane protein
VSKTASYTTRATRGFAWNHLYKLTEFGLLNLFNMLIARYFGPEGSVPYVVYIALGTTISAIAAFGVDGTLLRYLPRITEIESGADAELKSMGVTGLRSFVRRLFALRIFIVLIIISIAAIVLIVAPSISDTFSESLGSIAVYSPLLLLYLLAQSIIAFSTLALIALLETRLLFIVSIIVRSLLLGISAYLVSIGTLEIGTAVLLHAGSAFIIAGSLLAILFRVVNERETKQERRTIGLAAKRISGDVSRLFRFRNFSALLVTPVMLYGLTTYGNDMLSAVLGRQPDILMLRGFYGEHAREVGLYNVASMLLLVTEYIFFLGLGGALVSIFSKYAHEDETEQNTHPSYPRMRRARGEVAGFQYITLIPLCGFVFVFALHIIRFIYGTQYDDAALSLQIGIVLLAINVAVFGGGLPITSLVAIGKPRLVLYSRISWGSINLVGNFFLIKYYGVVGAIIGTNVCNMLACATEDHFARKYIGNSIRYMSMLRIVVLTSLSACCIWYLDDMLFLSLSTLFRLGISAVIYFFMTYVLFWILKLPEFVYFQTRLRSVIGKL